MTVSDRSGRLAGALLACGILVGPLFFVVFLFLGTSSADYDPLLHPISSLAFGDEGWTQRLNFVIAALLVLTFAVGMRRVMTTGRGSKWGPRAVGLIGIGLLGAGAFVADPLNGYPPGTPLVPVDTTTAGQLHDSLSTLVFLGFPAAGIVVGRWFQTHGERAWAWYSTLSGVAFFGAFVLTSLGFAQVADGALADIAGLLQRITLAIGFAWLTLLAIRLRSRRSVDSETPHARSQRSA